MSAWSTHGVRACLLLALGGATPAVQAQQPQGEGRQELSFGASVGATHSDNILRSATDEQSDTSIDAALQSRISGRTNRLDSELSVNTAYRRYSADSYPDDLAGGLDAAFTYWFSPQRFGWVLEDNFGQTFIDAREVETPNNRQNTNFFSTGPDLLLRVGDRTDVSLGGRFSMATYEETQADDQRYRGTVGLIRRLGMRSSLSVTGSYEDIQFKDDATVDGYARTSASLGFSTRGAHTTLKVEAGYTSLSGLGNASGGPLFNLSLIRELTSRSSITLNAGTSFTDSAEAFRRDRSFGGVLLENDLNPVAADPLQSDFVSLLWALRGSRTTVTVGGDWRSDDRETLAELDRDSVSARVSVTRRLSPVLEVVIDGAWRDEEFARSGVSFSEASGGLGFNWFVSRTLGLSVRGNHSRGSGDTTGAFGSRDYTENRYSVSVTYTPRR